MACSCSQDKQTINSPVPNRPDRLQTLDIPYAAEPFPELCSVAVSLQVCFLPAKDKTNGNFFNSAANFQRVKGAELDSLDIYFVPRHNQPQDEAIFPHPEVNEVRKRYPYSIESSVSRLFLVQM